jgi:acyl-CoA dehydrogenase
MGVEMDFRLSSEHEGLRDAVRDFVDEYVRPISQRVEREPDPVARFPWELIERASSQLGLRTLALDDALGGGGADSLAQAIAIEELSAGDMGIAQIFRGQYHYSEFFNVVADEEQRARFLPEFVENHRCLLAGAMTEPATGSDHSLPYDAPDAGPHTIAVREGDGYRITGRKTLITSGGVAQYYFVWARTDPEASPSEGTTWFLVPGDTPGLRIGRVYEKLGQRIATNAELIFEDCFVPVIHRLSGENAASKLAIHSNPGMGAAQAIGVARAAYESALSRARWRVQGGRPIIEHQAVAALLAEMAIGLETARTLVWRACWSADNVPGDNLLGMMAKVQATELATDVTKRAIQVFGGYGVSDDYPIEKYYRDAATLFHPASATNQVMLQRIAARLPADDEITEAVHQGARRYIGDPTGPLGHPLAKSPEPSPTP